MKEQMKAPVFTYEFVCRDKHGNVKWTETITNTVMTAGKNDLLDKYFSGSAYTAAWYVGLISDADYSAINAADTAASHSGWKEAGTTNAPDYDESARPQISWSAASSGSKAASSACTFTIAEAGTVKGAFVISDDTKDGTAGVLYSASTFSGDRTVADDDTINVTPTMSV